MDPVSHRANSNEGKEISGILLLFPVLLHMAAYGRVYAEDIRIVEK